MAMAHGPIALYLQEGASLAPERMNIISTKLQAVRSFVFVSDVA